MPQRYAVQLPLSSLKGPVASHCNGCDLGGKNILKFLRHCWVHQKVKSQRAELWVGLLSILVSLCLSLLLPLFRFYA